MGASHSQSASGAGSTSPGFLSFFERVLSRALTRGHAVEERDHRAAGLPQRRFVLCLVVKLPVLPAAPDHPLALVGQSARRRVMRCALAPLLQIKCPPPIGRTTRASGRVGGRSVGGTWDSDAAGAWPNRQCRVGASGRRPCGIAVVRRARQAGGRSRLRSAVSGGSAPAGSLRGPEAGRAPESLSRVAARAGGGNPSPARRSDRRYGMTSR